MLPQGLFLPSGFLHCGLLRGNKMAEAEDQLVRMRPFRYVCTYVRMYVSVDSELCIKCALACVNCTYMWQAQLETAS